MQRAGASSPEPRHGRTYHARTKHAIGWVGSVPARCGDAVLAAHRAAVRAAHDEVPALMCGGEVPVEWQPLDTACCWTWPAHLRRSSSRRSISPGRDLPRPSVIKPSARPAASAYPSRSCVTPCAARPGWQSGVKRAELARRGAGSHAACPVLHLLQPAAHPCHGLIALGRSTRSAANLFQHHLRHQPAIQTQVR